MIGNLNPYFSGIDCGAQLKYIVARRKYTCSSYLKEHAYWVEISIMFVQMLIQALLKVQPVNQREATEHIIKEIKLSYWII